MFDIGATELLLIVVVAILVIGPKDMPLAMRTAGRWIGKIRKLSGHFRAGIDAMVREAEMEDMEKKWKAQNEEIMREHPDGAPRIRQMEPTGAYPPEKAAELKRLAQQKSAANEAAAPKQRRQKARRARRSSKQLPDKPPRTGEGHRVMAFKIYDLDDTQAPLLDHLIELRARLVRACWRWPWPLPCVSISPTIFSASWCGR